jgi:hypothetical protein
MPPTGLKTSVAIEWPSLVADAFLPALGDRASFKHRPRILLGLIVLVNSWTSDARVGILWYPNHECQRVGNA